MTWVGEAVNWGSLIQSIEQANFKSILDGKNVSIWHYDIE